MRQTQYNRLQNKGSLFLFSVKYVTERSGRSAGFIRAAFSSSSSSCSPACCIRPLLHRQYASKQTMLHGADQSSIIISCWVSMWSVMEARARFRGCRNKQEAGVWLERCHVLLTSHCETQSIIKHVGYQLSCCLFTIMGPIILIIYLDMLIVG